MKHIPDTTDTDNPSPNGNGKGDEPAITYEHIQDKDWMKIEEETGDFEIVHDIQKEVDLKLPPETEADNN